LRQSPWQPWIIRFSGEEERSGWDWAELVLKVSVPILVLLLGTGLNRLISERQARSLLEQREDTAVTNFLKEMQPLLLERGLRKSTPNAEVRSVAHALALVTLSQLVSENAP
jgi:hypothetical protein